MSRKIYPPGPKPKSPFAIARAIRRDPVSFLKQTAGEYGDLAYFKVGPQQLFLLHQLDGIKDVLVTHNRNFTKSRGLQLAKHIGGEGLLTSEGEAHLRRRRLAPPAFHRQRIETYSSIMTNYAARLSERWQDGATMTLRRRS